MDGQVTPEALIVSYLLGELDEQRQEYVLRQISTDERWKQAYDELRKTTLLVHVKHTAEAVDLEKEWASFREARLVKEHPERFLDEAERFGNGVITEVSLRRRSRMLKLVAFSAVAASLLLAAGWAVTALFQNKALQPQVVSAPAKSLRVMPASRILVNTTGTAKDYTLEDGSKVSLAAGSELSFREPFEKDRRDLALTGSALFEVAKNRERPFTVYSGGIATTALGTRFTVTAYRNDRKIRVVLHEGKVVVKGVGSMKKQVGKDFYLTAGQEFVYEKNQRFGAWVRNTPTPQPVAKKVSVDMAKAVAEPEKPSIPNLGKTSWYMFNNQSLPQVFRQLESIYKTDIIYNRNSLARMYFIGTFSQGDSLETVLRQIAISNNLRVIKEHQKFIITVQE